MTALTPDRSLAQRLQSLERANGVRAARAELKRDIKAGREQVADVLLDPPGDVLTMRVFELMLAAPKYGRVKVNGVLNRCRISPSKTVGGLSERQRAELSALLGGRA